MRFDARVLLQDFWFFKDVIIRLDDDYFAYLTKDEILAEKRQIIDECKRDCAFKLLTLLETEIRRNFSQTIAAGRRDPLSRKLNELCDRFRMAKDCYAQSRVQVCRRIPLDQIFITVSRYFKDRQDLFHSRCSLVKGVFSGFRNWYAHGRYFRAQPPATPDPEELFEIYEEFVEKVLDRSRLARTP